MERPSGVTSQPSLMWPLFPQSYSTTQGVPTSSAASSNLGFKNFLKTVKGLFLFQASIMPLSHFFFWLQSTFFNRMGLIFKLRCTLPGYRCAGGRQWATSRLRQRLTGLELLGLVGSCRPGGLGAAGQTPTMPGSWPDANTFEIVTLWV